MGIQAIIDKAKEHRSVRVLLLLIERLKKQKIVYQIITVMLILLLSIAMTILFAGYIILHTIHFVFVSVMLRALEWYLNLDTNKSE